MIILTELDKLNIGKNDNSLRVTFGPSWKSFGVPVSFVKSFQKQIIIHQKNWSNLWLLMWQMKICTSSITFENSFLFKKYLLCSSFMFLLHFFSGFQNSSTRFASFWVRRCPAVSTPVPWPCSTRAGTTRTSASKPTSTSRPSGYSTNPNNNINNNNNSNVICVPFLFDNSLFVFCSFTVNDLINFFLIFLLLSQDFMDASLVPNKVIDCDVIYEQTL